MEEVHPHRPTGESSLLPIWCSSQGSLVWGTKMWHFWQTNLNYIPINLYPIEHKWVEHDWVEPEATLLQSPIGCTRASYICMASLHIHGFILALIWPILGARDFTEWVGGVRVTSRLKLVSVISHRKYSFIVSHHWDFCSFSSIINARTATAFTNFLDKLPVLFMSPSYNVPLNKFFHDTLTYEGGGGEIHSSDPFQTGPAASHHHS